MAFSAWPIVGCRIVAAGDAAALVRRVIAAGSDTALIGAGRRSGDLTMEASSGASRKRCGTVVWLARTRLIEESIACACWPN
jgi:hypothetical protein